MNKTQISTKSWHFKWLQHLGLVNSITWQDGTVEVYSSPKSICPYFWQVFFTTVFPLGLAAALVSFMVTHPMIFGWSVVGLLALIACSAVIVGIAFAGVFGTETLKDYLNNRPYNPNKTNFVVEFAKAKKNKVCPLIEYTD